MARLRAFLLNKKNKNFIGPVEPEDARGFDADLVVFERRPNLQNYQDFMDHKVFAECTLNSFEAHPILAVPLE